MSTIEKLDRLIADQLQAALPGAIIGRKSIVLEQTGSTNDAIWRVASTDGLPSIPEGLVVFAEHQTDGRVVRGKVDERRLELRAASDGLSVTAVLGGQNHLVLLAIEETVGPTVRVALAHFEPLTRPVGPLPTREMSLRQRLSSTNLETVERAGSAVFEAIFHDIQRDRAESYARLAVASG